MRVSPALLEERGVSPDRPYLASMGLYLFNKGFLKESLDNDFSDFGQHVIPAGGERGRVQAHFFGGYWRDIGGIRAFYEAHMDLVQPNPPFNFYDPDWPIYTHPRYLPGSRLSACRFNRSVLAGGATVEDSTIEDSVLGVRVTAKKARINRALIMGAEDYPPDGPPGAPPVGIGEGTLIQDAIVDLNARIGRNVRIVNQDKQTTATETDWVIRDGIVVIPKNAVIPDGTTI